MEGLVSERRNDINVDTTSSTRNFGCVLIRSGVTYLPKCTIPATSRWDSRISGDGITRIFTLIISIRNFDGIYLASDRDARPRNSLTHNKSYRTSKDISGSIFSIISYTSFVARHRNLMCISTPFPTIDFVKRWTVLEFPCRHSCACYIGVP